MKKLFTITAIIILTIVLVNLASVAVDRITVRDCTRGIKAACEEVERLNLK